MTTNPIRTGLPPHARQVFKGEIFEVWQWKQEMFDGTTEIFERIWRYPSVEVIATVGDKIMLEEQDQPDHPNFLSLVSGRADRSQDMLAEAQRELLEETGYRSDDWHLLWKEGGEGKVMHEVHYFAARDCEKVREQQLDAGERITLKLITFDDMLALADEPRFWTSPRFINRLLRARTDSAARDELHAMIFGEK